MCRSWTQDNHCIAESITHSMHLTNGLNCIPDLGFHLKQKDYAHRAARGIVSNLQDRRGVKNGFNRIDEDMRIDIVESIAAIIREAVNQERCSQLAKLE